jgi:hypothetical protein
MNASNVGKQNAEMVNHQRAAELTGYSVRAIEGKRAEGVWLEGQVWKKAPDGHIMISLEGKTNG